FAAIESSREATSGRGKDGKVQRSFGFAQAFARGGDFAQRSGVGERARTGANVCTKSTSWGSLVRAQYRPLEKGPQMRAFCLGGSKHSWSRVRKRSAPTPETSDRRRLTLGLRTAEVDVEARIPSSSAEPSTPS